MFWVRRRKVSTIVTRLRRRVGGRVGDLSANGWPGQREASNFKRGEYGRILRDVAQMRGGPWAPFLEARA